MTKTEWRRLLHWLYAAGLIAIVAGYLLLATPYFAGFVVFLMANAALSMFVWWKAN